MAKLKCLDRRGKVRANDSAFTGEEPEWNEFLSYDDYYSRKSSALNFYTYYCDAASLKSFLVDWMKSNKYDKDFIELVDSASPGLLNSTAGKLARMLSRGMPDSVGDGPSATTEINKFLQDWVFTISTINQSKEEQKSTVKQKPKPNPIQNLNNKVNKEIICPLEDLLDSLAEIDSKTPSSKMPILSIGALLRSCKIPARGTALIEEWIIRYLNEFKLAYDKEDDQLMESYGWLKRSQLARLIQNFEKMLDEVKTHSKIKTTRAPRAKKPRAAEKQIKDLKYNPQSEEYSVSSIDPLKVPFSHRLYAFNEKNRQLSIYVASGPNGLSIKGTSIKDFDTGSSIITTLRKPQDILPIILSGTVKKIEMALSKLKTKPKPANGRINQNIVLLRAFDKK